MHWKLCLTRLMQYVETETIKKIELCVLEIARHQRQQTSPQENVYQSHHLGFKAQENCSTQLIQTNRERAMQTDHNKLKEHRTQTRQTADSKGRRRLYELTSRN